MPKHILVPVDFSENALIAARYATAVAAAYDYKVHLFHAYRAMPTGFQPEDRNISDESRLHAEAEKSMQDFLSRLRPEGKPATLPDYTLAKGILTDVLLAYCKSNTPVCIVMGTRGATGLKYALIGSQTAEVARHVTVPLLIVPENTRHFQMRKAGLLSDLQPQDQQSLHSFIKLFGKKATVFILHIPDSPADRDTMLPKLKQHAGALGFASGMPSFIQHGIPESTESLTDIALREQLDMFILTIRDRSFFERLMHKSFSRAVINNPAIPVLLIRPAHS